MPPTTAARGRKQAQQHATEASAAAAAIHPEAAIEQLVANAFVSAHQSTAQHLQQRRMITAAGKKDMSMLVEKVSILVVKSLSIALPSEAQRRHLLMLREVGHAFLTELNDDSLSFSILRAILPYHNAQEKSVRTQVCSIFEVLLRLLDQKNERFDFYDGVVEAMKHRAHDKVPAVREKAISCLGVFQEGKKECDVTHHILAAMCEDQNSAVRRQAVQVGLLRDVYFPSYARMTRDTVASVRKAAWDQLGKFKFSHIVAYCEVYHVNLCHLLALGLRDSAALVRTAVSWAISQVWMPKECGANPVAFLTRLKFRDASDADMTVVATELLVHHKRHSSANTSTVVGGIGPYFPLVLDGMSPANLLMWRVSCVDAVDTGDAAEEALLPPLSQGAKMLQEIRGTYCRPERERKVDELIKMDDNNNAEEILRIFLTVFDVYKGGGYLSHADDSTRSSIVKQLAMLLKVVPDTDPGQFVETVVATLKELTSRHASEATRVIFNALELLFNELRLPKAHGMQFDDVEGFGRRDQERRQELLRLQTRRERGPHVEELDEAIDTDTKFLLRMMHITRAYLGQCERGDKVPTFCTHMIHLGRNQMDPTVKSLATKALCITCLMSPETVYTFVPLFVADATATPRHGNSQVLEAAVGGLFDLVCEYGLPFFDSPLQGPPAASRHAAEESLTQEQSQVDRQLAQEVRRRHAEETVKADDCAKLGGAYLLHSVLLPLLDSAVPRVRQLAVFSFCRLLACNRVPLAVINTVIAKVLLFHRSQVDALRSGATTASVVVAPASVAPHPATAAVAAPFATIEVERQVLKTVDCFLASYAYSQPKRMQHVAEGGLLALRSIMYSRDPSVAPTVTKLLKKMLVLTDAAFLQQVRDADPEFALNLAQQNRMDNEDNDEGDGDEAQVNTAVLSRGTRGAAAKRDTSGAALGTARLWRELARWSLHEWIAMELIVDAICHANDAALLKVLIAELPVLHLYQRDHETYQRLRAHADSAVSVITDEAVKQRLNDFVAGYDQLIAQGFGSGQAAQRVNSIMYFEEEFEKLPAAARIRWSVDQRLGHRTDGLVALGVIPKTEEMSEGDDGEGSGAHDNKSSSMRGSGRASGRRSGTEDLPTKSSRR